MATPADQRVLELLARWLESLELHTKYSSLDEDSYWKVQPWTEHQRPSRWIVDLAMQKTLALRSHVEARIKIGDARFSDALELMGFLANLVGSEHLERFIPMADRESEIKFSQVSGTAPSRAAAHSETAQPATAERAPAAATAARTPPAATSARTPTPATAERVPSGATAGRTPPAATAARTSPAATAARTPPDDAVDRSPQAAPSPAASRISTSDASTTGASSAGSSNTGSTPTLPTPILVPTLMPETAARTARGSTAHPRAAAVAESAARARAAADAIAATREMPKLAPLKRAAPPAGTAHVARTERKSAVSAKSAGKAHGKSPAKTPASERNEISDDAREQVIADAARLVQWGRRWFELPELIARMADRPSLPEVRRILKENKLAIEKKAGES